MTEHQIAALMIGIVLALAILVIPPLRQFAIWLVTASWKPFLVAGKVILHTLGRSHRNVIRNFLPRQYILFELSAKRTSYTKR